MNVLRVKVNAVNKKEKLQELFFPFSLELRSGPEIQARPEYVVFKPGPARHINCNYESESDFNLTYMGCYIWRSQIQFELFELQMLRM